MANELTVIGGAVALPEAWAIPASVDWSHGRNRAVGKVSQIRATDDLAAINAWLRNFTNSKETFQSYRKEAIRFMLWAAHAQGRSISDLTHEDMLAYLEFIEDPQPASKWVSGARKLPMSHPDWRPFYGKLSKSSQRQAKIILDAMFNWLVDSKYLDGNPLALVRQRKKSGGTKELDRYLVQEEFALLLDGVMSMPDESPKDQRKKARLRWVLTLLYLTGLRISEAVNNTMGGFVQRKDPRDGKMRWWLTVIGKGNKEGKIPATPELIKELVAYREAFGLPSLPAPNEETPLVFSLGPQRAKLDRQSLHRILKLEFNEISKRLERSERASEAALVLKVSAHWMRHSFGTNLMRQGMNIVKVRDIMRHENIATTNIYAHTVKGELHDEVTDIHKLPEGNS